MFALGLLPIKPADAPRPRARRFTLAFLWPAKHSQP